MEKGLWIIFGATLSLFSSWFVAWNSERSREKKKRDLAIKTLFISSSYNQKSFFDEKQVLKNRMTQGSETMLRPQWPIDNLDLHDHRENLYFLGDKSNENILKSLYFTRYYLKILLTLKEKIVPIFEKITSEKRDILKENASNLDRVSGIYNVYEKYIDYYLSEINKLIQYLREYAENEKIELPEIFSAEDLPKLE